MGTITPIQWTDRSWNPLRGCSRVSDECINCYAEKTARRFGGPGGPYEGLLHSTGAWNGKIRLVPEALTQPLHWVKGYRVFVNSMSDLFHENVPFEFIDKVLAVMACTTRHTYQVLTKRPERMAEYFQSLRWNVDTEDDYPGDEYRPGELRGLPDRISPADVYPEWIPHREGKRGGYDNCGPIWPLDNVWFGISAGRQSAFDERWQYLAAPEFDGWNLFLSAEPLLEPLDIRAALRNSLWDKVPSWRGGELRWAIVGGESGPGARPCAIGWIKDIVRQCQTYGTPVFVKQLGANPTNREGDPCPHIHARKGDDMAEWPAELRVREWPRTDEVAK